MPFQEGDVIEFDYEMWVEGREGLYDTTLREAAQREGLFDPNAFYAPIPYPVGSGRLIPGLERALREASLGQTREVEFAPEDAYGPRDPKLIETLPIQEFRKNEVTPEAGMPITYKNRRGVVTTVGGGRVRVDFNAPLAGKRLKYRFTVVRQAEDEADKVRAFLRIHFPAPVEWAVTTAEQKGELEATVDVPEAVVFRREWAVAKLRALMDIRRFTAVRRVRFVEVYSLAPAAEPEVAAASQAGAEGA
jgi:peptidylprolyl isomerase